MFNQLAQLKKMKQVMENERKTMEKQGVSVTVNGKMQIEEIKLNPNLNIEEQEKIVKECINSAFVEIQKVIASKML